MFQSFCLPDSQRLASILAIFIAAVLGFPAAGADSGMARERLLLDFGWKFHLGNEWGTGEDLAKAGSSTGPAKRDFSDAGWRSVDLPHDWAIELPFDERSDGSHGFKPLGPGFPQNNIAWYRRSFTLPQLGEDGRAALLALSLFVPSASRPALAEVAGFAGQETRLNEAVKNLAALRLVSTADEGKRLVVQGLTRELARARLARDPGAGEFRRRFVAVFLSYAREHSKATKEDYDALEAEKDNVMAAQELAFELEDWASVIGVAHVVASPVSGLLGVRGYWEDALRQGNRALEAAHRSSDERAVAGFTHNTAIVYQFRGDLEEARRLYEESLEINKKLGNQGGIAISLNQLGWLAQAQGEVEEARRLYKESLEIAKKLGNQDGIATSLGQLGILAQGQGEMEEARRLYKESLEIKKKLGNQSGIASSLHQLGILAQDQGEVEEARRLYTESLEISKKLGNQGGIASSLHNLAVLVQDQGNLDEARRLYKESQEINKKLGDQDGIAGSLHQLGSLAEDQGDKAEAARLFGEALTIFEKLKSPKAGKARRSLARVSKAEQS